MNISHWIERNADFSPDKVAMRFEGQEITYAELAQQVKTAAQVLKWELGVGRGPQARQQPGEHHRRFAAPRRADDVEQPLCPQVQRLAGSNHDRNPRGVFKDFYQQLAGFLGRCRQAAIAQEMLKAIQHEQHFFFSQVMDKLNFWLFRRVKRKLKRLRNGKGKGKKLFGDNRGKGNEVNSICEEAGLLPCSFQR